MPWMQMLLVAGIVAAGALAGALLRRRVTLGGLAALSVALVPILGLVTARAFC